MPQQEKLRHTNNAYQLIRIFLELKGIEWFMHSDVVAATGLRADVVGIFLVRNWRRKYLRRRRIVAIVTMPQGPCRRKVFAYRLRRRDTFPPLERSKGEIAEWVWRVLRSAKRPLSEAEIRVRVERRSGIYVTSDNVHTIIWRWYNDYHLSRIGAPGRWRYELAVGLTKRPSATA